MDTKGARGYQGGWVDFVLAPEPNDPGAVTGGTAFVLAVSQYEVDFEPIRDFRKLERFSVELTRIVSMTRRDPPK